MPPAFLSTERGTVGPPIFSQSEGVTLIFSSSDCDMFRVSFTFSNVFSTSLCPEDGGARRVSTRIVDEWLHGEGNSNSTGARPVHQIISMMKWIRTSRLSTKNSLCLAEFEAREKEHLSRVACQHIASLSACERRLTNLKGLKDSYLKVKARIKP